MDEDILRKLIAEKFTQREIGEKCGKSQASVRHWLKKYGLNTEKSVKNFLCQCGESDESKFALRRGTPCTTICRLCDNKRVLERGRANKLKALEYKGCCCSVCGYDKNPAALSFHHLDPKQKDTNFDKMRFWKFDRVKKELDKCILVCLNCHAEIHNPMEEYNGNTRLWM
jgi:predicted HNH restriction endonuclease